MNWNQKQCNKKEVRAFRQKKCPGKGAFDLSYEIRTLFEIGSEELATGVMAQTLDSVVFYLANSLTGHIQLHADFFKGMSPGVTDTVEQLQNIAFFGRKCV